MKISRWFIVFILLLFVLLVLIEVKTPQRYNWRELTYSHYDDNPFGAKLVDSLLSAGLKSRYDVKAGDINEAYNDSDSATSKAILFVDNFNTYNDEEADMLFGLLRRGNTVIIFTDNDFSSSLCEEINIESISDYVDNSNMFGTSTDSILFRWEEDSCYGGASYQFRAFDSKYTYFAPPTYDDYDDYVYSDSDWPSRSTEEEANNDLIDLWTTHLIASDYNQASIVISGNYEKGKLVLVSYPMLFSNYYVLEDGGLQLLMRILSQAGDKSIVRYDRNMDNKYISEKNKSKSPLRVFLDNKSLRWAVYLTLFAILISLFFTARRKQRVIPVVQKPKNQTIEMIKHIGLMYYRSHDNAGLISEKYRQLIFELQRKRLIYLDDENIDNDNLINLSQLADIDKDKLSVLIARIKDIDEYQVTKVSDKETKSLINLMNKILNNL